MFFLGGSANENLREYKNWKHGKDIEIRAMAEKMMKGQEKEVLEFTNWPKKSNKYKEPPLRHCASDYARCWMSKKR